MSAIKQVLKVAQDHLGFNALVTFAEAELAAKDNRISELEDAIDKMTHVAAADYGEEVKEMKFALDYVYKTGSSALKEAK